jgi:hypothetical protein
MTAIATALIVLALAAGFMSYVHQHKYGSARALEMGIAPHVARSGSPVDEGGATSFDYRISLEVILGTYEARNEVTLAQGRLARRWTLSSIALALAGMAAMAASL